MSFNSNNQIYWAPGVPFAEIYAKISALTSVSHYSTVLMDGNGYPGSYVIPAGTWDLGWTIFKANEPVYTYMTLAAGCILDSTDNTYAELNLNGVYCYTSGQHIVTGRPVYLYLYNNAFLSGNATAVVFPGQTDYACFITLSSSGMDSYGVSNQYIVTVDAPGSHVQVNCYGGSETYLNYKCIGNSAVVALNADGAVWNSIRLDGFTLDPVYAGVNVAAASDTTYNTGSGKSGFLGYYAKLKTLVTSQQGVGWRPLNASFTTAERDALVMVATDAGATIWNSTTLTINVWDGSVWKAVTVT